MFTSEMEVVVDESYLFGRIECGIDLVGGAVVLSILPGRRVRVMMASSLPFIPTAIHDHDDTVRLADDAFEIGHLVFCLIQSWAIQDSHITDTIDQCVMLDDISGGARDIGDDIAR